MYVVCIKRDSNDLTWMLSPVAISTRISLIVADIMVIVVTWIRSFRLMRETSRAGTSSVSSALLRDGQHNFRSREIIDSCVDAGSMYFVYVVTTKRFFLMLTDA